MSLFDEIDAFILGKSNDEKVRDKNSANKMPTENHYFQINTDNDFDEYRGYSKSKESANQTNCHNSLHSNVGEVIKPQRNNFDFVPSAPTGDLFLSQIFTSDALKTSKAPSAIYSQSSQSRCYYDEGSNFSINKNEMYSNFHERSGKPSPNLRSTSASIDYDARKYGGGFSTQHNELEDYKDYESFNNYNENIETGVENKDDSIDNHCKQTGDNKIPMTSKFNNHNATRPFRFGNTPSSNDKNDDDTSRSRHNPTDARNDYKLNKNIISPKKQTSQVIANRQSRTNNLRPVTEIPKKFRHMFNFTYFNYLQSEILDNALYSDEPLVVSAPTGSGKTVIFELAIIRLILLKESKQIFNFKIVYMAPIKALVSERFNDWKVKLSRLDLNCCELTGDTEMEDYTELRGVQVILTTPEKWDFMTRRWRDNKSLVQLVKLFLIDEIHTISDSTRGATLEAVVNRMKTLHIFDRSSDDFTDRNCQLRFIAVSATIPNIEDLADWLGTKENPALCHKIDDSERPVPLKKIVLGFHKSEAISAFKFDLLLNYRLSNILEVYSEMKPTLIFCSTRKGTVQTATTLVKETKFLYQNVQHQNLKKISREFKDTKLGELVASGIAYHHAGLDLNDRKLVEELFSSGFLAVLISTSTLAMGVNLPAHLVIVKSTQHYVMGTFQEYSESQVLQMIGRAGRPQFDTSATAVIMTQNSTKWKYESLLNGTQLVESTLHLHLIEHLNAEIVLQTITDVVVALEWIKSSFLYIRMNKNPKHYDVSLDKNTEQVEKKLQELCLMNLNKLASLKLISMDDDCFGLSSTDSGRLMARYCVAFDTMKLFFKLTGSESMEELFNIFCSSEEFKDVTLRVNEKKVLNDLNKHKNNITIRFPMKDKIKTNVMKVNCLLQTQLGCLLMHDFALQQDTNKIFRSALRISKCLVEVLWNKPYFKILHNAVLLSKSMKAKLWENSKYVAKQINGIGLVMATALVNSGVTSFESILKTNPRNLELMVNRQPPFGNTLHDTVKLLPTYDFKIIQYTPSINNQADLMAQVKLVNAEQLRNKLSSGDTHMCIILIGGPDNKVLCKAKIKDTHLIELAENTWSHKFVVKQSPDGEDVEGHLISQDWVGFDVSITFKPTFGYNYEVKKRNKSASDHPGIVIQKNKRSERNSQVEFERILEDLKRRSEQIPVSPAFKRLKTSTISNFAYDKKVDQVPPSFTYPIQKEANGGRFQSDFFLNQSPLPQKLQQSSQAVVNLSKNSNKPKPRSSSYIIESPCITKSDPHSTTTISDKSISHINLDKLDQYMGVFGSGKTRIPRENIEKIQQNASNDETDSIFKVPIGQPFSNREKRFHLSSANRTNNNINELLNEKRTVIQDNKYNLNKNVDKSDNNEHTENMCYNNVDFYNKVKDTDDFYSTSPSEFENNMITISDQCFDNAEEHSRKNSQPPCKSDSVPDFSKIGQTVGNFDLINESSFFNDQLPEETDIVGADESHGQSSLVRDRLGSLGKSKPRASVENLFAGIFG